METEKKLSFEQAAARIDEIVKLLEKGDAPLDKSLTLFEEGARLIKTCGKMLDEAEQTIVRLQKGDDGEFREVAFDNEQ
jgi:exodeoxyribonuclease VII small subunit